MFITGYLYQSLKISHSVRMHFWNYKSPNLKLASVALSMNSIAKASSLPEHTNTIIVHHWLNRHYEEYQCCLCIVVLIVVLWHFLFSFSMQNRPWKQMMAVLLIWHVLCILVHTTLCQTLKSYHRTLNKHHRNPVLHWTPQQLECRLWEHELLALLSQK